MSEDEREGHPTIALPNADPLATTRIALPSEESGVLPVPRYRLRAATRDGEVSVESRGATVRVGTRPENDLVIADSAVSRIHFEILADAHGFRLRDLGSTNGTRVDGVRANDVYLRPGASIGVGQTTIVFEPLDAEVQVPLSKSNRFGALVGRSPAMRELFARLERVANTDYTVLIEGESGTGKELVAEALHAASPRSKRPFVVFDCAAIPDNLVESELFGHEKGAFTDAGNSRMGYVEEADGGTLFLDEIGELPLDLQAKLLRVLEKREFRRLGGKGTTSVDVRVIAATNRDLAREVNAGTFRDDLYYRLAVVRLEVPPLRSRPEDVRPLVEHFVRQAYPTDPVRAGAVLSSIATETWKKLEGHAWRGNVRELRNTIHRALALSTGGSPSFEPSALAAAMPPAGPTTPDPALAPTVDLSRPFIEHRNEVLASFERAYLLGILEKNENKISRASQAAGLDRTHFKRLLARYRNKG